MTGMLLTAVLVLGADIGSPIPMLAVPQVDCPGRICANCRCEHGQCAKGTCFVESANPIPPKPTSSHPWEWNGTHWFYYGTADAVTATPISSSPVITPQTILTQPVPSRQLMFPTLTSSCANGNCSAPQTTIRRR